MTPTPFPRLGFLGTGKIAGAMVEGFGGAPQPPPIVVSPRGEARSLALARRWPNVARAGDNQEVLDRSDLVFLALRPPVAPEVVPGLRFRADHTVVALFPGLPLDRVGAWVRPAVRVFKALPLPSAARRFGPVLYFPEDPGLAQVLGCLGEPLATTGLDELNRLWAATGLLSPFFALLQAGQDWCVGGGARPGFAGAYLAAMVAAMARMAEGGAAFGDLAAEAATPGGLNEMTLGRMRDSALMPGLEAALEAVMDRLRALRDA